MQSLELDTYKEAESHGKKLKEKARHY